MSDNIDVTFARLLLVEIHKDVRRIPDWSGNVWKAAWTYCYGRDQWEFHGPNKFYYSTKATNGYDARCQGWTAYIRERYPDLYAQLEDEENA